MVQLKLERTTGEAIGVISWFAVHPTSMNNSNTLVSSDNVGYASILFEKKMNPTALPGKGKFVAAFASSNLGDVSPNLRGPRCTDTGEACDVHTSTCDGANVLCVASGPGVNMFESTRIIGDRLYTKALELFEGESTQISGPIRSIHQYVNMAEKRQTVFDIQAQKNQTIRGCLPAMGYSFAAGTTDGPGAFTFIQGMTSPNELWNAVRDFLITPSAAAAECQAVKPILIPTGEMRFPFEWQPQIVSTGIVMLGNFTIVAVPGEFTTMAGRRLRLAVWEGLNMKTSSSQESSSTVNSNLTTTITNFTSFSWMTMIDESGNVVNVTSQNSNSSVSGANGAASGNASPMQQNMENLLSSMQQMRNGPPVVVAGLCNTYSSYIVTPQEYTRYEAASTIYGPHTLSLYEAQYRDLARAVVTDTKVKPGPTPRDLKEDVVSLVAPVIFDSTSWNRNYGDCIKQPPATAAPGDTVSATFISGHPRNNLMLEGTFMRVERRDVREGGNATWTVVATDANWETKYKWYRTSFLLGTSESRLEWTIPEDTEPATYRIRHYGHAKYLFGGVFPYRGSSRSFQVVRRSSATSADVAPRNSKRRFFNWS
ncbi:hypothetical protein B566_EDAN013057 [Ephemera danica]|nr:hypothetical protein B566_EDAN013057 [Ephemera danica]